MASRVVSVLFILSAFAAGAALRAVAQTTTGSIRGYVTDEQGQALSAAEIVARNVATGVQRTTTSQSSGFYALPGLTPAEYELTARRIGLTPQTRRLQVLIGQTLTVNLQLTTAAVQLAGVEVRPEPVAEMRTSEVATNITPEQVNNLPTSDRSFLTLVALAPGTSLQGDRIDGMRKTFTAGAQGAEQINVFIDGASYKNDILKGGVAGQDASRGNPFPRNAVQEFRVLTQNYKAEYQKASSAIITATTKSGSNAWSGNAFYAFQDKDLLALTTFQRTDRATNPNFRAPDYSRHQVGVSFGGPLMLDRLHFFGSYEGNYQDRSNRVDISPPPGSPALDTVNFAQYGGDFGSPFRGTLLFGKLSYAAGENSSFELSYNHRHEKDIRDFGGLTAYQAATRFKNDVNTAILKHSYIRGTVLNEATVSYQRYRYNPVPAFPGLAKRLYGFGCCAQLGSGVSIQDFTQKRLSFRDDVTYSGLQWAGQHVVKIGANTDFLDYDIIKRNSEIPLFVYEPWWQNFAIPQRVELQVGDPNFGTANTQIGVYVQDDWSPTSRLTLNLGIRWDYESGMLNYDYVTPARVVDSITKYRDSLFIPLDAARYFTDGTQRDRFLGGFQPRLGFSYALDDEGRTVVFGGLGVFYDRTLFDQAIEEKFALQHPSYVIRFRPPGDTTSGLVDWDDRYLREGRTALEPLIASGQANTPEAKLLPNDLRPPKSNQFSLGVRRTLGTFVVDAAYTGVRSNNTFTFYWGNFDFPCGDNSCGRFRRVNGFSNILFATNAGKTWYDALQLKVDRPYRIGERVSWGGGLAYTFAKRQTQGFNDDFSFPNGRFYPKEVRNDERHRVVANWIVDLRFAYGVQFGGLLTLGSGADQNVGDRFVNDTLENAFKPGAFSPPKNGFLVFGAWAFRNVDLRLRKDLPLIGGARLSVTVDLFNAFNYQNLGGFVLDPRNDDFGKGTQVISDPRRLQVGTEVNF